MSAREGKVNVNASYVWSLKKSSFEGLDNDEYSQDKRIPISSDNRDHELDCVDFLVALYEGLYPHTNRLTHWDYSWSKAEKAKFDKYGVKFDRRFVLDLSEGLDGSYRRLHFLEMDRGTKDLDSVYYQMKRYARLFEEEATRDELLLVVTKRYRFGSDEERENEIMKHFVRLKFGGRAAITTFKHASVNPLARIWRKASEPDKRFTLAEL